jgi:hypothetical protein
MVCRSWFELWNNLQVSQKRRFGDTSADLSGIQQTKIFADLLRIS